MKVSDIVATRKNRAIVLASTALGCTLIVAPSAIAQNVAYNGPGPYTLTQTTPISGGPRSIDVTVTSGDATVDTSTTTITNSNTGTALGAAITVNNTGAGAVTIRNGQVDAIGSGPTNAVDARATTGLIDIVNTGTINASGNNTDRAISASSGGGDVTISSNVANGQLRGIAVGSNGGSFGATGTTTINSTTVTANGTGAINAILGQGNRVVINSGSASNTNAAGNTGTAIFANASTGGVLVNAGTTTAFGQNQAAIQVFSEGVVDVTSGTIRTTQNSDGLSIASGTDVVVRSTSITTEGTGGARAIVLGGNAGGGGFNSGPNGFAYNSAVVTSGSISTVGNGAHGIYVTPNGAGRTTINSDALTTTGANANGIFVTTIGTGVITGPVTIINTGTLQTSGANASGIRYLSSTSGTGPLTVDSNTIVTRGTSGPGMFLGGFDGLTIRSGSITTTGAGVSTGIQASSAATATGATSITSGLIVIRNASANGSGIVVSPGDSSATVIDSDIIENAGTGGGIGVQSSRNLTGDITINSRDITLGGAPTNNFRNAIGTFQTAGTTTVNSTGTIQSSGAGIQLQARAGQTAGAVKVTSNIINSFQTAINIAAGSVVTINAATTSTSGDNQAAIIVNPSVGGAASINAGTLTTTGTSATGILVGSNAGVTGITVGTANTTASAVDARTAGALSVTSGTARVMGAGATGLTAISSGGDVTVQSSDLAANGRGIFAQGRDNASVTSGVLTVTGADQAIFAQTSFGQGAGTAAGMVTVNSGTLSSTGGGINAAAPRGTVMVTSGTLTAGIARGIGAFGIDSSVNSGLLTSQGSGIFASFDNNGTQLGTSVVNSDAVTINGTVAGAFSLGIEANNRSATINSGTITTSGLGNRAGISAQAIGGAAAPGDVLINSGSISTVGDGAWGIQAIASAGAVTVNSTGTITTTGTTRLTAAGQPRYSAGIIVAAQNGAVAIASNNVSTSGAQSDGIRVESGAGIVTYNQNTIGAAPIAVTTTGLTQISGANAAGINILGGGGAVTVNNTGTIAATGAGGTGIRVLGGVGAVTIDSATSSAASGDAIFVQSGDLATVRAASATGGGDGGSGVFVTGGSVALTVGSASSNGANAPDANGAVSRADAIFAEATAGEITAQLGSASATGAGADAVRLIANGANGAVTANITGTLNSTGGYGLFIDPPGAVIVNVAGGAQITGALGGINAEGGSISITNSGTISATGGAAIIAAGPTALDNRGTIAGTGGTAAQLSGSNDVVTLRTGSVINGAVVGGGGTDAAVLIGGGTTPIATQTVAGFVSFDSLTVQSGYWTAPAAITSTVAHTIVNGGAALELQNGPTGIAGYATRTIADDGLLVVRSTAASAGNTFGATTVTGSGNVTFTGAGVTTLAGNNTLANTGTNLIEGGTVLVTGTQGGNFTTASGGTLQVGSGGTTGVFTGNLANNGTLIVNRSDDAAFNGALTGAGLFVKEGAGRITFGTGYAFTGTTQLNGGAIRLTGPVLATTELDVRGSGQIDFSGTNQTVAELQGNSPAASVNIAGGSLTVNQATSTVFAGVLAGAGGSLIKAGPGTLNLTGASTYTGPTAINGGRLLVNGSTVSPVTVNAGGTLGGTGAVGATTVASGGTWAPGNSIGTQTVNGNVAFATGSIYQVEVNAAGAADRINATGSATLSGGTVQVLAETGTYGRQTDYTILAAQGGVSGRFANVTSNFAFLTPVLGYSGNAVSLTLARNDLAFGTLATTGNQLVTANAIFGRGPADLLFNTVLFQSAANAPIAFTQLSGELNAALPTELTDNSRRIRQAVLDRGAVVGQVLGLWIDGLQSTGMSDATPGRARLKTNRTGVVGGVDYAVGGIRFGGFGGYQDSDVQLRNRGSSAEVESTYAGVHVGFAGGPLALQLGGLYAWHNVDTARTFSVGGLSSVSGRTEATSKQLFAEAAYAIPQGAAVITPFIRNAYTWTRVEAFTEAGGTGALSVDRVRRNVGLASAGVRLTGTASLGNATFLPRMSIAYEYGYGDRDGTATQRFGGTGPAFTVAGAGVGKSGLMVDGGFDVAIGAFSAGLGGFAATTNRWSDYGGKATIGMRF